jgi:hypothetical protein
LIDRGGGANCVSNFFAGDEAGRRALANAGAFRDTAQRSAFRQSNEQSS